MAKKNETPLPLVFTNQMAKEIPQVWKQCDEIIEKEKEAGDWDPICELPYALASEVYVKHAKKITNFETMFIFPSVVSALYSWRKSKQIYRFPKEMRDILYAQADTKAVIPVEVLRSLPYRSIYIEADDIEEGIKGYLVYFDYDFRTKKTEFRLIGIGENSLTTMPYVLFLEEGKTIEDSYAALQKEAMEQHEFISKYFKMYANKSADFVSKYERFQGKILHRAGKVMQLVLYICAANAEVTENPEQKKIYRKRERSAPIKDKMREVQAYDVGEEISTVIRKIKKNPSYYVYEKDSEVAKGKGSPKRPHMRKGHYHYYWRGKRGTAERKAVLNWVAPMFINKAMTEDNETKVITVNKA